MIAVIDISGNNLTSLANALNRLDYAYEMTHCPEKIIQASHVILPGVGAAAAGMAALREHGLIGVLKQLTQPLLGICLGMQLLLESSEEGETTCLGLIPGHAKQLPHRRGYPVPHMGWNRLQWQRSSSLQTNCNNEYVYFVHSYALTTQQNTLAECEYSEKIAAIIQHKNIYGMQFHPEKSAETGLNLLNNFLSLESVC